MRSSGPSGSQDHFWSRFFPFGLSASHPRLPPFIDVAGCGGSVYCASGNARPAQSAYGSGGSTTGEATFACQRMEIGMQASAAVLALHVALPMASRLGVP